MTPKQERFVQEYLIDLNATQAAIRAGYSATNADVTGPRLLGNVGIATAIEAATFKTVEKLEISREWILAKLKMNAERSLQETPVYDKEGKETGVFQYQGNWANKALELLGKNVGMFSDKLEVTGKDGAPIIVKFVREDRKRTAS